MLYVLYRSDHKKLRTIYGNDKAASVTGGGQPNYPYGSVMVLETWSALKDADANTMRKEKGFGAAYGAARNGEREYVGYTLARAGRNPRDVTVIIVAEPGTVSENIRIIVGEIWRMLTSWTRIRVV